jgi:hypothetical protein
MHIVDAFLTQNIFILKIILWLIGGNIMANTKSEEIRMLEVLIDNAASGKAVDLNAKPVREVVKLEREGHEVDTVILSMEYSGIFVCIG